MHPKFLKIDTNCKFKQRRKTCSCQGIEFNRTKDRENKQDGGITQD